MKNSMTTLTAVLAFMALFLTALPAQAQEDDGKYREAIELADRYFSEGDYLNAKASYQLALQLKPGAAYPGERLQESIGLLRKQLEKMALFNERLGTADRLFGEGAWDAAITAYEEAKKVMPSDPYPDRQIGKIREKMAEEAAKTARFNDLLTAGKQHFDDADYVKASETFTEALELFPENAEAKALLEAAGEELAFAAGQESEYDKAISEARMYHARKDYENELLAYQRAAGLKPDEALPQAKIREVNEFLRKYESYNLFVSEADELYITQQYALSGEKYKKALEVLPGENYPREMISKVNAALAEKTERNRTAYEEAVAKADELYNQENYEDAMIAYSDALRYWPDGDHARKQLIGINEIMAMKKAREEAYANAISLADKHFSGKAYPEARAEYRKAADIQPFEQYPKVRISEIDMILSELQSKLETYEQVIQGADKLFNVGDYELARTQYLKARDILADRSYPDDQIRMIDEILNREQSTREAYLAAIARGDEFFAGRLWEKAKGEYMTATDLIPAEQYPRDRITEINNLLAQLKAEQENYTLALKAADRLLTEKDYRAALGEYRKAAAIFTDEEYPRQKIEEIESLLAEEQRLEELEAEYSRLIAEADALLAGEDYREAREKYTLARSLKGQAPYPAQKIGEIDAVLEAIGQQQMLEEQYAAALSKADAFFEEGSFEEAKAAWETAAGLKPGESYPRERILEATRLIEEAARLREIEDNYAAAILSGDEQFERKQYEQARESYREALAVKPSEAYPAGRMAEIDRILAAMAEQDATDRAYAAAIAEADRLYELSELPAAREAYLEAAGLKPAEAYPAQRISEIENFLEEQARLAAQQEAYATAIATADLFFGRQEYGEAREAYERALSAKNDETYPQQRIAEIDSIRQETAERQRTEEGYANAIALADNHFNNKEYLQAKEGYEKALGFKPGEAYAAGRISEVEGILADVARREELQAAYSAAINEADSSFALNLYAEAGQAYREAMAVRPGDSYAEGRLKESEERLERINRERELDEQYNSLMARAGTAFERKDYAAAREAYQAASALKPGEELPAGRIIEIDALMAEQARLAETVRQYARAIAGADSLFALSDWEASLQAYREAGSIKKEEDYPQEQIDRINTIIREEARQKKIDEDYRLAVAGGDEHLENKEYMEALQAYELAAELKPGEPYPGEQISGIRARLSEMREEQQKAFEAAMAQANSYFDLGNYRSARSAYQTAVNLSPEDKDARAGLEEADRRYQEELETLKVEYRKYIADADNYFREKIYDAAIENYRMAAGILPDEEYPMKMVSRITQIINDNAITDVNKLAQVIPNNTDRRFNFEPLPASVRKQNYILIKARNMSEQDYKMLVNFGKDNSKTGGVVLPVPAGSMQRDYIIRIGALYRWFSEDNNWLSIYPEGGDIEVALIRISKSD
jgi:tetratricopeptide (TPR) repeat protein